MLASPELRVLGDLDVRVAGRPVAVGGAVPRALLLRLALAGGATVVDGVLQDDLWDGAPPPSAPGTVQAHVSRLRRALHLAGAARDAPPLVRRGSGYALLLDDDALDARAFERLAARGGAQLQDDPEAAAALLDEALALWRGPALVDVAHRPWAEAEAQRLEQLRVAAREDRVAADLALGRETAAAAGAESLVAAQPLRERGWELLALALYRQGRQADALARLRELRDLLADELGAEPGPAAAALVQRVLSHDPTLLLASPSPSASPPSPSGAPASPSASSLTVTSNLPASPTPLVGRGHELDQVAGLLAEHRLVTLTGTGGTGKTRLALEVARRRSDPDGPWLVRLAAQEDGDRVPAAVAVALGLVVPPAADPGATVAAVLRDRDLLLLLDDCEHLVDQVADLVEELLRSCPHLRVLVTSREPLRVDGEHIYDVPVLSGGPDGDAVQLFVARAGAAAPGWRPGPGDAEQMARLCAALDGLPLAVELAAAQLRSLSLPDLLGLLDDHEALLRGGRRTSSRHETMQRAIAWSYDRLLTAEQEVLADLSVFAGSFDMAAAQEVLGRRDVLSAVSDLVARSLVAVSPGSQRRFWLLSVVRSFASAALPAGRRAELTGRHVAWVVRLAEAAPPQLRGLAGTPEGARIAAAGDDVVAALAVARPADALRIAVGAFGWLYLGESRARASAERLLAALEAVGDDADAELLSRGWRALSLVRRLSGDGAAAVAALGRAARYAQEARDPVERARVLADRSFWTAWTRGSAADARADAVEALAVAERAGGGMVRAHALLALGATELLEGALDRAVEHLEDCVATADAHRHPSLALTARQLQAKAELVLERWAPAWTVAMDSVERAWQLWEAASWLTSLGHLAAVLLRTGAVREASAVVAAMDRHGAHVGYTPGLVDPDVARFREEVLAAARAAGATVDAGGTPREVMALLRSLTPAGPGPAPRGLDAAGVPGQPASTTPTGA